MARRRTNQETAAATLDEGRLRELVAQKAHQLWEQRGCCHGQDLDHWLEAEQVVKQEVGLPRDRSTR